MSSNTTTTSSQKTGNRNNSSTNPLQMNESVDVTSFLQTVSQSSVISAPETHFIVDPSLSNDKSLKVTSYPGSCASRWVELPVSIIESIMMIGVAKVCGMMYPHVVISTKDEFKSLLNLFADAGGDSALPDISTNTPYSSSMEMPEPAFPGEASKEISGQFSLSSLQDDNRLRQDLANNALWQWDNNATSCTNALSWSQYNGATALNHFLSGQAHNAHVQNIYRVAYSRLPDFWHVVATVTGAAANFGEARANLNWQYSNNLSSLDRADREWRWGRRYTAFGFLASGQRHNPGVLSLYRACFRDNANHLFGIVASILGR